MSLCIWTSLHLNLPEHKKAYLQKYRKLSWMVLGLLTPELVVWNAWDQRKKAKRLSALMREKEFMPEKAKRWARARSRIATAWQNIKIILLLQAGDLPEIAGPKPHMLHNGHNHAWTDVHSWFVIMGGIAFEDRSSADQRFMPWGRQRIPLTVKMFKWIVEHRPRLVPDISRGYIEDKSKSDWLAKGLTCWQACYFCIQCIYRLYQGLSITLLELNVFAHAICALFLFLVWWDKPRDVSEPTLISSEDALDICACFCHLGSIHRPYGHVTLIEVLDPPPLEMCFKIVRPTTITARASMSDTSTREGRAETSLAAIMGSVAYDFLTVQGTYWRITGLWRYRLQREIFTIPLTGPDIRRLTRVYAALQETPKLLDSMEPLKRHSRSLVVHNRKSNWNLGIEGLALLFGEEDFVDLYESNSLWLLAGVSFAGACYGGLHLIAWASDFPSQTEAMMWRAASVTILVTGPLAALVAVCLTSLAHLFDVLGSSDRHENIDIAIRYCLLLLPLLWYTVCRTFVVVECFILLAHIPETALHVPTWAAYIPSFS